MQFPTIVCETLSMKTCLHYYWFRMVLWSVFVECVFVCVCVCLSVTQCRCAWKQHVWSLQTSSKSTTPESYVRNLGLKK